MVLASEEERRDPARLASLIERHRCSHIAAVPALLAELAARLKLSGRGLHILAAGESLGAPLVEALLQLEPASLIQSYGATETCLAATFHPISGPLPGPAPLGRPIPDTVVRVLDRDGRRCPIGVPGELHIGGPGLARGYLHQEDLTAARFLPDPFAAEPGARLFRSGDRASWTAEGTLVFHGRLDHQIKLRGFRIEPGEIEEALRSHPAVREAVVVLRQTEAGHSLLVGYVIPAATPAPCPEELRGFLAERLPDPMVPSAFVAVDGFPRTSGGKLDRQALPPPPAGSDAAAMTAPGHPLECQLFELWAEVLGHQAFGIHDNFFLLGGHSLSAARVTALIEQRLGVTLPIARLFQAPTIAQLAGSIGEPSETQKAFESLVPLQPLGEATPLFVIHGGNGDVYVFLHLAKALRPERPVYGLQALGLDGSRPAPDQGGGHGGSLRGGDPSLSAQWALSPARLFRRGVVRPCRGRRTSSARRGDRLPGGDRHRCRRRCAPARSHPPGGPPPPPPRPVLLRELPGPSPSERLQWLRARGRALKYHLLGLQRRGSRPSSPQPSAPAGNGDLPAIAMNPTRPVSSDYFLRVHALYRPPRLPVAVDVFATASTVRRKRWIWSFYALRGVIVHPFLKEHSDFYNAALMPALARLLRRRLEAVERSEGRGSPSDASGALMGPAVRES